MTTTAPANRLPADEMHVTPVCGSSDDLERQLAALGLSLAPLPLHPALFARLRTLHATGAHYRHEFWKRRGLADRLARMIESKRAAVDAWAATIRTGVGDDADAAHLQYLRTDLEGVIEHRDAARAESENAGRLADELEHVEERVCAHVGWLTIEVGMYGGYTLVEGNNGTVLIPPRHRDLEFIGLGEPGAAHALGAQRALNTAVDTRDASSSDSSLPDCEDGSLAEERARLALENMGKLVPRRHDFDSEAFVQATIEAYGAAGEDTD